MKKFLVSNWKMLPETEAQTREILSRADEFLQGLAERVEPSLIICPPFVFLDEVQKMILSSHMLHDAELGAQDISTEDSGAMTGEVSGSQLTVSGVRYVIVGHSERRWKMGEDDAIVNAKLKAALRNDLVPIVCVGERTREGDWKEWLSAQVRATFADITEEQLAKCFLAYEPVWAISTTPGATPDTPDSALESIKLISSVLSDNGKIPEERLPRILYGGSVNPDNAEDFLTSDRIHGVLVGGASVRPDDYVGLLRVITSMAL